MPNKILHKDASVETEHFSIHTGQECDVLVKSASDGQNGTNWQSDEQSGSRTWWEKGATHKLVLGDPQAYGGSQQLLSFEQLTSAQSIDSAFAFFYICGVLAPPATDAPRIVGGFIDLNDVMKKIGWLKDKPDAATRDERRMKVWQIIRFFASVHVIGQRSIPYKDPDTGVIIPTRVETAPWSLDSPQVPEDNPAAAPLRVRVVISSYWEPLLTSPQLTQFMPLGEVLGAISSGKPSGDWARTIGLTLARLWRMKPQETRARTFTPTRRQLLTTYTPKTTVESILGSKDPKHAVRYYIEALGLLADNGFVTREGDATERTTPATMLAPYGRQGWADRWLDGRSGIFPGEQWVPTLEKRAESLPVARPKNLKATRTTKK